MAHRRRDIAVFRTLYDDRSVSTCSLRLAAWFAGLPSHTAGGGGRYPRSVTVWAEHVTRSSEVAHHLPVLGDWNLSRHP
jgi:hypothetical protein